MINRRLFAVPAVLSAAVLCASAEVSLEQAAFESRAPFHETGAAGPRNAGDPVVAVPPASGSALGQLTAAGKAAGAGEVEPPLPSAWAKFRSEPFVRDEKDGFWARGGKSLLAPIAWPLFLGPLIGAAVGYKLAWVPGAIVGAVLGVVGGVVMGLVGFIFGGIPQ